MLASVSVKVTATGVSALKLAEAAATAWTFASALYESAGACRVCVGLTGSKAMPCITARAHAALEPGSNCVCSEERCSKALHHSEGSRCMRYCILMGAETRPCIIARAHAVFAPDPMVPQQGPASQRGLAACLRWTQERHGKALHHSKASCRVCAESESAVAKPCITARAHAAVALACP